MFELLTEQARRAHELALEEARRLGDGRVGADHLLLGLAGGEGTAARVLAETGVTLSEMRAHLAGERLGAERSERAGRGDYTRGFMDALELAVREVDDPGHDYAGTGHFLLAVLSERLADQAAVRLLGELGKDLPRIRRETSELLGEGDPERPVRPASARNRRRPPRRTGPVGRFGGGQQRPSARSLRKVVGIGLKQSVSGTTVALTSLEIHEDIVVVKGLTGVLGYLITHQNSVMEGFPGFELEVRDRNGRRYEVEHSRRGVTGENAGGSLLLKGPFDEEAGEITVEINRLTEDTILPNETPQSWEGPWTFRIPL